MDAVVRIILGNACSLLAMVTDSVSSTRKTAKGVLWVQNLSQVSYFASAMFLKGYSSAVQNVVSLVRNLAAIRKIESKAVEWSLVLVGVTMGLWFNNLGLIGYLPVLANLQYTLAVFRFRDNERALKIAFALCVLMFAVFNAAILNFVGVGSNLVVLATTLVNLFKKKTAE